MLTSLTGIKPTGSPHIGNYFGAILPAIELSKAHRALYFIADYHSLNASKDASKLRQHTYEVAAAWLASGLDPRKVVLYRQSDVPEICELATILSNVTAKGLMNRAHAYKAAVAGNLGKGADPDKSINMGFFAYPILMAADILLFDADVVPVGGDQTQHIEIAGDIAKAFNHAYSVGWLKSPKSLVRDDSEAIVGTDGRKMSKSYNNTIPLFSSDDELRRTVMQIKTNSQSIEEPKNPLVCSVFALYKLFSNAEQQQNLAKKYRKGGMSWAFAKEELFDAMQPKLAPLRTKYLGWMEDKTSIDGLLREGKERARHWAHRKMQGTRRIIGVGTGD